MDPQELDGGATSFSQAGDGLAALDACAPQGDPAAAVPQLVTTAACRNAQSSLVADMAALAQSAHDYGDSLHTAAINYRTRDLTAASAIRQVPVGG